MDASTSLSRFQRDGFFGPVELLTERDAQALARYLDSGKSAAPADWPKGRAVTDWLLYRIAADPSLTELLSRTLGEDVVLWGCSILRSRAGRVHPWHVDIESSAPDGRFVTAWVGLRNTSRTRSLELIAGSHLCGRTIQQVQSEREMRRGEASTEVVLEWARQLNPAAEVVRPDLKDGEAILMDGRLWHGSRDDRLVGSRATLLLQFASAASAVRMYDRSSLEWPFEFVSSPRPPVIVVAGKAAGLPNRIVPPPASPGGKALPMLSTCIRSLELPFAPESGAPWQRHNLFHGATPALDEMECHASVLGPGHSPHPPHSHEFEELLIILDGEAELVLADGPSFEGARIERVGRGDFAYYPAFQHHTIRNPGSTPISYLMFKWHIDRAKPAGELLGVQVFRPGPWTSKPADGFPAERLFDGATRWLGRLNSHRTQLAPGAGYAPHADAYDVAILTHSGTVETLDQEVGPNSVIFYAAGRKHGMRNIGDEPATYLVFEFHPARLDIALRLRSGIRPFARRMAGRMARAAGIDPGKLRARLQRST